MLISRNIRVGIVDTNSMQIRPHELGHAALEALPVAVLVADKAGLILKRNAAADDMCAAGDDLSRSLRCRTADGLDIDWQAELATIADDGRVDFQALHLETDSGVMCVDIHAAAMNSGSDAVVFAIENVNERESMLRRLTASERMAAVGQLAAKVAHELNNPLDGILRYVGLAERVCGEEDPAKTRSFLEKVRTGVTRMADIVADLLNYSRSAGRPTQAETVRSLIEEAVDAMGPHLDAAGVVVMCDLDDSERCRVGGDIFQVLCNLIKNAADAMPGGGRLTITSRIGDLVTITVADTGEGIAAEHMDEIFRPFFTTKTERNGTGLGLSICREIARRSGGDLTAANRGEGGAVFTLTVSPCGGEQGTGQ